VLITGKDVCAFRIGSGKVEYSNIERYQRLLGLVEQLKFDMMVNYAGSSKKEEEGL
jgi:hypothetical protein